MLADIPFFLATTTIIRFFVTDRRMSLEIVILAAGQGKRMLSDKPKVMHELAGKPMLTHVLNTARQLNPSRVHVVVGDRASLVKAHYDGDPDLSWVEQAERLGTGHATTQALPVISDDSMVLVMFGDVPLMTKETLGRCVEMALGKGGVALVTADLVEPSGYGRIIRGKDERIIAIVEERDANETQRSITEVNTGVMAAPACLFKRFLAGLSDDNSQSEYYLTDVVVAAVHEDVPVSAVKAELPEEAVGVNDRMQLARLERHYQRRRCEELMLEGVSLMDPSRVDLRGALRAGTDCVIDINVVFEGDVVLGDRVRIGPNCFVRDCTLGDGVIVEANTVIDGAHVGREAMIGPFARLRPGTELGDDVKIGNFVETKKARVGAGTKASHLAYLGDATLGEDCNVGAGTITCNYDGVEKHETHIGSGVFIGTNATLVAPLLVEDDAYIGAGSTITAKVEKEDLAVGRGKQRNIKGWTPPSKRKR